MKLLVVETNSPTESSLATDLHRMGYEVDFAVDGIRAVALAAESNYDLIILDLELPKESSLLVLHEIRETNPDVVILILAAEDQIHDRITALIQGASDYLIKPCSPEDLGVRVQALLQPGCDQDNSSTLSRAVSGNSRHVNRLIANLLGNCSCEHGPIELVISEVKLDDLLKRIEIELHAVAAARQVNIRMPRGKLPTLLVDARLMQHLLVKLLTIVIENCPRRSIIDIGLTVGDEYCMISINSPPSGPPTARNPPQAFGDCRRRVNMPRADQGPPNLSLAHNYAQRLNFDLSLKITRDNRISARLSQIKLV